MDRQINNRKKLSRILALLICLFLLLCEILVLRLNTKISTPSGALVYDNSATDVPEESEQAFNENTIIPCFDVLILKANTKEQEVSFYNPAENTGINFKITLLLDNEAIYESKLIPPGKQITYIELYKELESMEKTATVLYECFADDGTILNGSKMNFTLKVEE